MFCPFNYLLGAFIIGYVGPNTEWPFYMQIVLFQRQQEHYQHEQSVHHKERKHGLITQFL